MFCNSKWKIVAYSALFVLNVSLERRENNYEHCASNLMTRLGNLSLGTFCFIPKLKPSRELSQLLGSTGWRVIKGSFPLRLVLIKRDAKCQTHFWFEELLRKNWYFWKQKGNHRKWLLEYKTSSRHLRVCSTIKEFSEPFFEQMKKIQRRLIWLIWVKPKRIVLREAEQFVSWDFLLVFCFVLELMSFVFRFVGQKKDVNSLCFRWRFANVLSFKRSNLLGQGDFFK